MMSRSWLYVIGGCIAVTLILAWFKYSQISDAIAFAKSFPEPMETVEFALVEEAQWQATTSVTADVRAIQAIDISNELSGRVVELGFASGDKVRKGQLLVRFDTSEELAQLAAAKADEELALLALERNQKLAKSGVASAEERDSARAQSRAAIATADRLQAIIDKKTLRAPFAGKAGIYELEVGQYLQANTLITRLVGDNKAVWLDFNLPQQHAYLTIDDSVEVSSSKLPNGSVLATIIARDSWVNPRSGNLRYRAITDNLDGLLYPGSVVSLRVATGQAQIVARIPTTAVRYDAIGANVYVLQKSEAGAQAPERASKRPVSLGREENQSVIVTSGLRVGERVAANGAFKLRDGILVTAVTRTGPKTKLANIKPEELPDAAPGDDFTPSKNNQSNSEVELPGKDNSSNVNPQTPAPIGTELSTGIAGSQ